MRDKWIVFDAMGVIFEEGDDNDNLLVPYIQDRNPSLTREKINDLYYRAAEGMMSSSSFWEELGFGDQYPDIEHDYLDTMLKIDPEFIKIADELSESYWLAYISNDISEWSSFLRKKFDLDRLFEVVVVSGDVSYRKPDKIMYEILLDSMDTDPSHSMIVDDRTKNLLAPFQLGMHTVHFLRKESISNQQPQNFAPEFEIRSFTELPEVAENAFR